MSKREDEFWAQLKSFIVGMEQIVGSNIIRVKVHAPVDLLMQLGRFYKFELSEQNPLDGGDERIYADAWFSLDTEMYNKIAGWTKATKK